MDEVYVDLDSEQILHIPLYNKGSAFTREERKELGLEGLLPYEVSSIEDQAIRRYKDFTSQKTDIDKFLFLSALQNRNEILFYRLVGSHITEMLPYIYTPTVGDVSLRYSALYHKQRGLYLAYPDKDRMFSILSQWKKKQAVDIVVVTDGERILGLGDVGVGGMAICIGKLALYTLFGGVYPGRTLPIFLDVGTNNAKCLEDPGYLGWKHKRVSGSAYEEFVASFIATLKKVFPNVLLQWEDFSKEHARKLLHTYEEEILSFNDDIQGTAAVVLAAILVGCKKQSIFLKDQKIAVLGAGSAGMGICDILVKAMILEGCSETEAYSRFYLVDRCGLLQEGGDFACDDAQRPFMKKSSETQAWTVADPKQISLAEVVSHVKPTILIGVSAQKGAFTEEIIKTMAASCEYPLILPLSNPNDCSEAIAADLIKWTEGKALVATGSPFPPAEYKHTLYPITQCNNVYIFPAMGLAAISFNMKKITEKLFIAAAQELSRHAPVLSDPHAPLFPSFEYLGEITNEIALAIAKMALEEGLIPEYTEEEMKALIQKNRWKPKYPIYHVKKSS